MSTSYPFRETIPGEESEAQRARAKQRRLQSRSDEDIEEEMDNRGLFYRKGWPQLPPLPVTESREGARALVNSPMEIVQSVMEMCKVQQFPVESIYFAFRVPAVRHPDENYLTLVVTGDFTENPAVYHLIIQIRKLFLKDPNHVHIFIELIDARAVHGLYSFVIPRSEKVLRDNTKEVYNIALEEIGKQKQPFLTLELSCRGIIDDPIKCPPTLIITSPTAAEKVWIDRILPDIHNRLYKPFPSLEVELLCGSTIYLSNTGGRKLNQQYWDREVPMGASIGHETMLDHSGTAGGVVKLSNGKTYALTNHHVVRNNDLDKILNTDGPQKPLKPKTPGFDWNKHRLFGPSTEDHKASVKACEFDKERWSGVSSSNAREELQKATDKLNHMNKAVRYFGATFATSGLQTNQSKLFENKANKFATKFVLDWALVEFHPQRRMVNELPLGENPYNISPNVAPGWPCTEWTRMNDPNCNIWRDEVVGAKAGRTTDLTHGYVDSEPVPISPKTAEFAKMADAYGLIADDCGYAMRLIKVSGQQLVLPGDSGSIVMKAPDGKWIGLLFGQTSCGSALFTPIDLVFQDIERVTGYKVVEPQYSPNN